MNYDLSNDTELIIFKQQVQWLIENKKLCTLDKVSKKRSLTQNKALYKYFSIISDKLNDMGFSFAYTGLKGLELELRYTPVLVKEVLIKPIMSSMFHVDSTTMLNTAMINDIIDVMNRYFSLRGEYIPFPSIESLMEYYKKNTY